MEAFIYSVLIYDTYKLIKISNLIICIILDPRFAADMLAIWTFLLQLLSQLIMSLWCGNQWNVAATLHYIYYMNLPVHVFPSPKYPLLQVHL